MVLAVSGTPRSKGYLEQNLRYDGWQFYPIYRVF